MTTGTLITGGGRGLGRNTDISIARAGGDVILTYQSNAEAAQALVSEIEALSRKAVAQLSTFAKLSDDLLGTRRRVWGRDTSDHLVGSAGHGDVAMIGQVTETHFDALVDVHFKSVFCLTQALLPLIADEGRIVNLSTGPDSCVRGRLVRPCGRKGHERGHDGLHGEGSGRPRHRGQYSRTRGDRIGRFGGAVRDTPEYNDFFGRMTSLGRVGQPDDIGPTIASLVSGHNRWTNAQRIGVLGGRGI